MINRPLTTEIQEEEVRILVGIDTLGFAADRLDSFNIFDTDKSDWVQKWKISDCLKFSKEVIKVMNEEGEDGSTPLTRFLDYMITCSLEKGAEGVEEIEYQKEDIKENKCQF
jgi:hypothetical protein